MLLFCPNCSNLLTIKRLPLTNATSSNISEPTANHYTCATCPYAVPLTSLRLYDRTTFPHPPSSQSDVIGGKSSWDNVDKTSATCPNELCGAGEAYFFMVQIRSADEPMTAFYRCVGCGREWRE